jgi:translation initiation factor 5B
MEAGGITQQIGATFVPVDAIRTQTTALMQSQKKELDFQLPGLLIIDTPGHEAFSNLRTRGSGLCDIAVLVIDLMHGLEPQTIESINLLKMRKTPFIVALNKVDRCFGWKPNADAPFQQTLASQPESAQTEFEQRAREVKLQLNEQVRCCLRAHDNRLSLCAVYCRITWVSAGFAFAWLCMYHVSSDRPLSFQNICVFASQTQGLNCELYYRNTDFRKFVSLVPTSAITGEGIPDLLLLITQLTQSMMGDRLSYSHELQCTVLEVKMSDGIGYTIDVILVNGVLRVGDTIVLCGMQVWKLWLDDQIMLRPYLTLDFNGVCFPSVFCNCVQGPIVTKIRTLLTPQPMKEMRVKNEYASHQEVKAAMGVKICAHELEHAVSGSQLFVCNQPQYLESLKDEVMADLASIVSKVSKTDRGLYVQASTLGSLEALLRHVGGERRQHR